MLRPKPRCVQGTGVVEDADLYAAARRLRCTTFFGRFGLGFDGCQADHAMLVVQWRGRASGWSGPRRWPKSRSQYDGGCAGYSLEGEQKWGRK